MRVCALCAPLLRTLLFALLPLTWPAGRLLECAMGKACKHALYERSELRAVIALHAQDGTPRRFGHRPGMGAC